MSVLLLGVLGILWLGARAYGRVKGSVAPAAAERDLLLLRDAPRSDGQLPVIFSCNYYAGGCFEAFTECLSPLACLWRGPIAAFVGIGALCRSKRDGSDRCDPPCFHWWRDLRTCCAGCCTRCCLTDVRVVSADGPPPALVFEAGALNATAAFGAASCPPLSAYVTAVSPVKALSATHTSPSHQPMPARQSPTTITIVSGTHPVPVAAVHSPQTHACSPQFGGLPSAETQVAPSRDASPEHLLSKIGVNTRAFHPAGVATTVAEARNPLQEGLTVPPRGASPEQRAADATSADKRAGDGTLDAAARSALPASLPGSKPASPMLKGTAAGVAFSPQLAGSSLIAEPVATAAGPWTPPPREQARTAVDEEAHARGSRHGGGGGGDGGIIPQPTSTLLPSPPTKWSTPPPRPPSPPPADVFGWLGNWWGGASKPTQSAEEPTPGPFTMSPALADCAAIPAAVSTAAAGQTPGLFTMAPTLADRAAIPAAVLTAAAEIAVADGVSADSSVAATVVKRAPSPPRHLPRPPLADGTLDAAARIALPASRPGSKPASPTLKGTADDALGDKSCAQAASALSVQVPSRDASPEQLSKIGVNTRAFHPAGVAPAEVAAKAAEAVQTAHQHHIAVAATAGQPSQAAQAAHAAVQAAHMRQTAAAALRRSPEAVVPVTQKVEGWPSHSKFGTSDYAAGAAAAVAASALSLTSESMYGRPHGHPTLVGGSPTNGRPIHSTDTTGMDAPIPAERTPTSALGGDGSAAVEAAAAGGESLPVPASRVAEVKSQLRSVLVEVRSHPSDGKRSAARRFGLMAHIESEWSMHWSQVDLPALLRDTSLAARELLASDPTLVSQAAAEVRAGFESLEAIFTYYSSLIADDAAIAAIEAAREVERRKLSTAKAQHAAAAAARDVPISRTLGEAAWLAFCAHVSLGSLADLSWFAPPNDIEAAPPQARLIVGERALFHAILERRSALARAAGGRPRRGSADGASAKRGLSFSEFVQALLLASWRRVALPTPAELAARSSGGEGPWAGSPHGAMSRAVREVIGRGVLPHASKLDVLPFRRALASSSTLQAAAYALQPAFHLLFEHLRPAEAASGASPPGKAPATSYRASVTVSLADFSRLLVASGLLDVDGFALSTSAVAGAFFASLGSGSATSLSFEAFVEATMRLAAVGGGATGSTSSSPVKATTVAASSVVTPSPGTFDEAGVLARLPGFLARQLLAALSTDGMADLALGRIENAAIERAKAGEPDPLLDDPHRPLKAPASPWIADKPSPLGYEDPLFSA